MSNSDLRPKAKLLNKFNDLEGQIEKKEIGFTLSRNQIASLQTQNEISNKKYNSAFELLNNFYRVSKRATLTFATKIWTNSLTKSVTSSKELMQEIQKRKQSAEIKANSIINILDTKFDKSERSIQLKNEDQSLATRTLKYKLENVFLTKNIELKINFNESNTYKEILDNELEIFNLLGKKIVETKMQANLFAINVETFLLDNKVQHELCFELKTKGLRWALFFSKYVNSDLNQFLSSRNGNIYGEHVSNVTLGRDKFILSIVHDIDEAKIEITPQVSTKVKSLSELGI